MLHIIRQTAFANDCLAQCLAIFADGDELLLLDDGSYNIHHPLINIQQTQLQKTFPKHAIYLVKQHAKARAMVTAHEFINVINIDDVLNLIFKHDNSITW